MCLLALFCHLQVFGAQSVTLSWNASSDPTVAGYKIYYGTTSGVYPNSVDAGGATNLTITGLADGSTNYFAGTTYDASGNESSYSSEIVYVAPGTFVSTTTTTTTTTTSSQGTNNALNVVSGLTVIPNPAASNSVVVSWSPSTDTIMAGYLVSYGQAGASPTVIPAWQHTSLVVTGLVAGVTNYFAAEEYDVSWNLGPMPTLVPYCIPSPSGSIPDTTNITTQTGDTNTSTTVTNITTTTDTNTISTTTTNISTTVTDTNTTITTTNIPVVTAPPLTNTPPTLAALSGILLNVNSATQAVVMGGISPGVAVTTVVLRSTSATTHSTTTITSQVTNANPAIKITATSSKPGLIPNPVVSYASPNSTGNLLFKPKAGQTGTATITVTINNGGMKNNIVTQSFAVTIINFADLPKITRSPTNSATLPGKNITIAVAATGQALKYQWKFNGQNLPGKTSATLSLTKVTAANTGAYSVQISNTLGLTNSLPAVVTVITNPAPVFSPPVQDNGQFSFQISGVPGGKYVVEASADLQHWSPVATNTAPFTFSDKKVADATQKFYRSFYVEP